MSDNAFKYSKRIADILLAEKLETMGAVLIEGPKACGKTTTAEQQAQSIIYMDDPTSIQQNLHLAETDVKRLLQGNNPRLIDEWQIAPQIWDAVRFEADHRKADGLFILTGSAVPADNSKIQHTGAGRFAWLTMRPMTLWESDESSGEVSLKSLFTHPEKINGESSLQLEDIAYVICRGGWPKSVYKKNKATALKQVYEYFEAITRSDISRVDGVERNEFRAKRLMRSYARLQGAMTSIQTIVEDMRTNEVSNISDETIASYIKALKKIFVIEDMPAWNPNLRSKTAIRTSDTRYFVDPSLAVAALGLGPNDLINDLNTMGLLFETLCVRDLRVYAEANYGNVFHYRDKNGLECDAVVHLRNGNYGLIEIKLGGEKLIDEGVANLINLENKLDTTKMKKPSFKMVLTAVGQYAYMRTDGVMVVPIGCLKD
ncbi:MAG: ATP-binding protein [Paludibacteraceae bacterium]|nr:ATP-binding protein [Paludibacteraceae bacterium]